MQILVFLHYFDHSEALWKFNASLFFVQLYFQWLIIRMKVFWFQ